MRMVVDLPAPLGPRKPKISPRPTWKLTRLTATKLPNRFSRSSTTTACRLGWDVRPLARGEAASRVPGAARASVPRRLALRVAAESLACRPPRPAQHRDEHVFQRRLDRRGSPAAAARPRARTASTRPAAASGAGVDHVDAVAEQADRLRRACCSRSTAAARRGSAGADLQDRAPHQPLDLVGRAAGQQPAAVDQRQAVAALGLVQVGGGDEDRHLLAEQLVEDPPEVAARDGIDAVGRLVEEQHLRRVDQRAGQPSFCFIPPEGCPPAAAGTAPGC